MRNISLLIFILLLNSLVIAQNNQGFKYQAIIRDVAGNVNANTSLQMEISILQGTAEGTLVFTETHNVTSNTFGLVNLTIGSQNPSSFELIDWANGSYFIKINVDGVDFGTSQLLSVPYALHAKTAESVNETDPIFASSIASTITQTQIEEWTNKLSEFAETDPSFNTSVAAGITATQIESWTNKLDEFIETDPEFAISLSKGITATDTAYWNSKLDEFVETDPTFLAHPASGITEQDITMWKALWIWYTTNQQGYLKSETDPVFSASKAAKITETDIENLENLSGINTGDQDISGKANKTLDNLSTVGINTSLISDTHNTDDLGSNSRMWKDLYIGGTAHLDSVRVKGEYSLPTTDGTSGEVLGTDGGGSVSWVIPSGPPTGAAGGDLSGTFPNPTIASNAITQLEIADGAIRPEHMYRGHTVFWVRDTHFALVNYDGSARQLRWQEPSSHGTLFISFQAPPINECTEYILPVKDGTNGQVLTTNGSAQLSWTTPNASPLNSMKSVKKDSNPIVTETGFSSDPTENITIDQKIIDTFPELALEDSQGNLSIEYNKVSAVLFKTTKDLKNKNKELEERITKLEELIKLMIDK